MNHRLFPASLCLALAVVTACTSAGKPASQSPELAQSSEVAPPADEESQRRARALAALQARQQAACDQLSTILSECAVADAKASLSAKELEDLDLDHTAPRHRAEVYGECLATDMSMRQVKVIESCIEKDRHCDVFVPCLDAAQPEPK